MLLASPLAETKPSAFSFPVGKEPRTDWNIHDNFLNALGKSVVREKEEIFWKILLYPLSLTILCIIYFLKSFLFIYPGHHFQQHQELILIKNLNFEVGKKNKSHLAQLYILKMKELCLKEAEWLVQWYTIM